MLCRNPPSTLVSLDNTATSPSSTDSTNRDPSLSAKARERKDSEDTITEHDDRKHPETAAVASKDPKKSTIDDGERNDEKRRRTWSFGSTDDNEVTKKGKMDDDRNLRLESPPQRPRNLAKLSVIDWPQRSPMESSHSCNGDEKRCAVDETNTSSSSSGSRDEQQHHDHLALLSGSFDTISVCASVMETMQEQTIGVTEDGLLSPRQKTHNEDAIALLSPQRESTNPLESNCTANGKTTHSERKHAYNPSLGTKDDNNNHYQRYDDDSPHSPPQRIIHVDGDDNGCGDISPIKFSPPTDSPTDSPPSQSEKPSNVNESHRYEHPKAAEVSFDNSTGYQRGHKKELTVKSHSSHISRMRQEEEEESEDRRLGAYSASEVKTPSRRGTSKSPSTSGTRSTKQSYKPVFPMAPPIPRDLNRPHVIASYYPHHPPEMIQGNPPPSEATLQRDQSKGYYHGRSVPFVRSGQSSRADYSSPIRPSRQSYRRINTKENSHSLSREHPPTKYESPYNGGKLMGHGYSSTPREYPPPRARLPPHSNNHYWNPNHNSQHQQYPHYPTQEIATHGHSKGMRGMSGIPSMPSLTDTRSHYYHPQTIPSGPHPQAPTSNSALVPVVSPTDPFDLIRSIRKIFQGCSYLLYPVNLGAQWGDSHRAVHPDPEDLKVARRRIESAIYALGGYIKEFQEREGSPSPQPSSATPTSVFRRRMNYYYKHNASMYRNQFHNRYFVGDHGVSWEVEENPPIAISVDNADSIQSRNRSGSRNSETTHAGIPKSPTLTSIPKQDDTSHKQAMQNESFLVCQPISSHVSRIQLNQLQQQKMKYRCKLCGQPKQNHVCPYRKSLVRTLGIMVCPAVNAYNSAEPGVLSPPLSEMNNFVPYGRGDRSCDFDNEVSPREHTLSSSYIVTPGGSRNDRVGRHHSPATSSSSTSPHNDSRQHQKKQQRGQMPPKNLWQQQKPSLEFRQQPLFMTLALRPEHYRAVTSRAPYRNGSSSGKVVDERDDKEEVGSYKYPQVPLTFLGRKRLADTLFYLSQSIPSVTADVASLLRMARERDEWDLAVSEVLTQVVVCIYCSDGDYRLDGLKNYLLKIGIAS